MPSAAQPAVRLPAMSTLPLPAAHALGRLLPHLAAALLMTASLFPARAAEAPVPVQRIERAVVQVGDDPPREVALPDTWARRGVADMRARGRYEFDFRIAALPDESLALLFTRLSTQHTVRVNGELISGVPRADSNPGLVNPALLSVPPTLLHVGRNTVQIDVWHAGSRAGLSSVEV